MVLVSTITWSFGWIEQVTNTRESVAGRGRRSKAYGRATANGRVDLIGAGVFSFTRFRYLLIHPTFDLGFSHVTALGVVAA